MFSLEIHKKVYIFSARFSLAELAEVFFCPRPRLSRHLPLVFTRCCDKMEKSTTKVSNRGSSRWCHQDSASISLLTRSHAGSFGHQKLNVSDSIPLHHLKTRFSFQDSITQIFSHNSLLFNALNIV